MVDDEHDAEATQPTQPKGKDEHGEPHEPIEIPVPKREEFERLVRRAAGSSGRHQPKKD
jgi:hypothetical protein